MPVAKRCSLCEIGRNKYGDDEYLCHTCNLKSKDVHIPNIISRNERVWNIIISAVLLIYGGYGIYINDLYIPGKKGGIHLHNEPTLIMYGAFICGVFAMLSVVIDHYDKRNNERKYEILAKIFKYLAWGLFVIAIAHQLFIGDT